MRKNKSILERDKPLILVVDDDIVTRLFIEKALANEHYDVVSAVNGQEALELYYSHSPDMIVMDVMMPVMNGFEACEKIRKDDNPLNTPILMLTGLNDVDSIENAFESGATDFIVKPFSIPIFIQRIRYALKTRDTDLELYKHQMRLAHAHKVARLGYWDWDIRKNYLYWSEEVFNIFSVEENEFSNNRKAFLTRAHPDDLPKIRRAIAKSIETGIAYSVEHRVVQPNGEILVVHLHAELMKDDNGKVIRMLGVVQDITERYHAQETILHQAYYDSLTDLPNRSLFQDRLHHALEMTDRKPGLVAIMFIDLDRFKIINDSLGHAFGDAFLKSVSDKLTEVTRGTDTLARLGGDEFALIVERVESHEEIACIAEKLVQQLAMPHYIDGRELITTGSIGITICPENGRDREVLIKQADLAMYHAKESGGNQFCFYSEDLNSRAHKTLMIENELRHALDNDEIVVFYQPKIDVLTGDIKGMEALLRWDHPEKGLIPPNDFIPLAEESGLIIRIGRWVLEEACRQTVEWHNKGYKNLSISVNVSPRQFNQGDLVAIVRTALENAGLAACHLDLEVTESCTMMNLDNTIAILNECREMGVKISMDDFGTGFSSLSFLNQMPLDTLKVDRAFIKDVTSDGENGELAKLIIAMAKSLNLSVVAEGIETDEHLNFLKENGSHEYQGFLASPPVPANVFERLLERSFNKEENASPISLDQADVLADDLNLEEDDTLA